MSSLAYKLPPESEENTTEEESSLPLVRPRVLKSKNVSAPTLQRESEPISVSAIIGFALTLVMVVLILLGHIQLDRINEETTALSAELSSLEEEYEDLSAQYEQLFDMDTIKSDLLSSGAMIQITSEQQIYMDLSQPDSSTVYEGDEEAETTPLSSFFTFLADLIT